MKNEKIFAMPLADVYPHYVRKVTGKGRTQHELEIIIHWLTGCDATTLQEHLKQKTSFKDFFEQVPHLNPNSSKITGVICGHRVEDIQDPLMQKIRYLDKLVDELAKGKALEKILRK
jgi:hypothetical protein